MDMLSTVAEIRDLLNHLETLELNRKARGKKKPQPKKTRPLWLHSEYPFERMQLGATKRYPLEKEREVTIRVTYVNYRMKKKLGLPNHFRTRRIASHGRFFVEVWRDK